MPFFALTPRGRHLLKKVDENNRLVLCEHTVKSQFVVYKNNRHLLKQVPVLLLKNHAGGFYSKSSAKLLSPTER